MKIKFQWKHSEDRLQYLNYVIYYFLLVGMSSYCLLFYCVFLHFFSEKIESSEMYYEFLQFIFLSYFNSLDFSGRCLICYVLCSRL